MKITLLLLLKLFCLNCEAQNIYKFSNDIEKEINSIENKDNFQKYQIGAMKYSISNYYFKGLQTWDKQDQDERRIFENSGLNFVKCKIYNGKDYILKKSKESQIVILNEAHHHANHRTFATSLLNGLYKNGYRYLGIEALGDDLINIRKFPTTKSGFYTSEPQFGIFIKTALDLGFTLFGYEAEYGENGKYREIRQADNINRFMQKNKKGKYFIYCGYEHVYEGKHQSWGKTMAGRLSDLTDINPFTIDQTEFSEKSNPESNSPILGIINKNYPVALLKKNQNELATDIRIIHPATIYTKGRPSWMLYNGGKFYEVPILKIKNYPSLIFAYRNGEFENNGIPVDIIELQSVKDSRYLVLDKGDYDIVVKDKTYNITNKFEKTIE